MAHERIATDRGDRHARLLPRSRDHAPYRLLVVANETLGSAAEPVRESSNAIRHGDARGARRRARARRSARALDLRRPSSPGRRGNACAVSRRAPGRRASGRRGSSATTTRCSRSTTALRLFDADEILRRDAARAELRVGSRSTSSSAPGSGMRERVRHVVVVGSPPGRDRGVRCGGLHSRFTGGSQSRPRAAWCH